VLAPLSGVTREKCHRIEAALFEDPVDALKLKKLALSEGGLVTGKFLLTIDVQVCELSSVNVVLKVTGHSNISKHCWFQYIVELSILRQWNVLISICCVI
jgi:predicted homoserine dehydrogenase-like protein